METFPWPPNPSSNGSATLAPGDAAQLRNTLLDVFYADFGQRSIFWGRGATSFPRIAACGWSGELDHLQGDLLDRQLLFQPLYQAACGSAASRWSRRRCFLGSDFVDARLAEGGDASRAGGRVPGWSSPPTRRQARGHRPASSTCRRPRRCAFAAATRRCRRLRVRSRRRRSVSGCSKNASRRCRTPRRSAPQTIPPRRCWTPARTASTSSTSPRHRWKTRSDRALLTNSVDPRGGRASGNAARPSIAARQKHLRAGQPLSRRVRRRLSPRSTSPSNGMTDSPPPRRIGRATSRGRRSRFRHGGRVRGVVSVARVGVRSGEAWSCSACCWRSSWRSRASERGSCSGRKRRRGSGRRWATTRRTNEVRPRSLARRASEGIAARSHDVHPAIRCSRLQEEDRFRSSSPGLRQREPSTRRNDRRIFSYPPIRPATIGKLPRRDVDTLGRQLPSPLSASSRSAPGIVSSAFLSTLAAAGAGAGALLPARPSTLDRRQEQQGHVVAIVIAIVVRMPIGGLLWSSTAPASRTAAGRLDDLLGADAALQHDGRDGQVQNHPTLDRAPVRRRPHPGRAHRLLVPGALSAEGAAGSGPSVAICGDP